MNIEQKIIKDMKIEKISGILFGRIGTFLIIPSLFFLEMIILVMAFYYLSLTSLINLRQSELMLVLLRKEKK